MVARLSTMPLSAVLSVLRKALIFLVIWLLLSRHYVAYTEQYNREVHGVCGYIQHISTAL